MFLYHMCMNIVSASGLNPSSRHLFPLLDPTVGRTIGAYLQFQKNEGKPESLKLEGELNDGDPATPDVVSLNIVRDSQGLVKVDGSYAGAPVAITIEKSTRDAFRPKDNLIFGQAGSVTEQSDALMQGTVGGDEFAGLVSTRRQEVAIDMTPELLEKGKSIYVLPFTLGVTPTFGGSPAKVNGLPGDAPTNSRPLATTDQTVVQARFGETQIAREQKWVTTTWTTSTNLRDGGSRVEMKQAETATEKEVHQDLQNPKTSLERSFEVDSGKSAKAEDRAYRLDFAQGVITGDLVAGETKLSFQLSPT